MKHVDIMKWTARSSRAVINIFSHLVFPHLIILKGILVKRARIQNIRHNTTAGIKVQQFINISSLSQLSQRLQQEECGTT